MSDKIPATFQIGLKWKNDEGKECQTVMPRLHKSGKRFAFLYEHNCIGSVGGMHNYAAIKVPCCAFQVKGEKCIHMAYGGKKAPKLDEIRIEVERKIKPREKDAFGESIGRAGEMTCRFNEPETARQAGIKLFKEKFDEGWVLVCDDIDNEDERKILAST